MNKRFIQFLLCLFLFMVPGLAGISLFALQLVPDSSHVVVREPAAKFIEPYQSQKAFTYWMQPPLETNFLDQLIQYLKTKFKRWKRFSDYIPLIFKILIPVLFVFFLFLLITKTKLYKLFYADKAIENPDFSFAVAGDQTTDFDEAIRLQIIQQNYRLAIRLLYLQLISQLRKKEYIHFSKEKTNVDYLSDLSNEDLRSRFFTITSIYNHVWYGDVEIGEDQFLKFEKGFQSFYSLINVQE